MAFIEGEKYTPLDESKGLEHRGILSEQHTMNSKTWQTSPDMEGQTIWLERGKSAASKWDKEKGENNKSMIMMVWRDRIMSIA